MRHLDPAVARRVIDKLQWLADNSHILRHEPLRGDWEHVFKLRAAAYRVLYSIEDDHEVSGSFCEASKTGVQEAVTLPSRSTPKGNAFGVQLIGAPFREDELLCAARWCEAA